MNNTVVVGFMVPKFRKMFNSIAFFKNAFISLVATKLSCSFGFIPCVMCIFIVNYVGFCVTSKLRASPSCGFSYSKNSGN